MQYSVNTLRTVFVDAFRHLGNNRPVPEIEVRFYPYAGVHHTIRIRSGKVFVRISDIFKEAPLNVHRALAFILVAKLLSKRTPDVHERVYKDFACTPKVLRASDIVRRRRGRKMISSSRGQVYDLDKMFQRINKRYFDNALEKPTLTWSQRKTRRILGHHDSVHDTITISKTLDSREVPEWFVEYILYHEMLHIKHPARLVNGRRYYHTSAFRNDEMRFEYFDEAMEWLETLATLRHVPRARAA
jgi:hypothetical protein